MLLPLPPQHSVALPHPCLVAQQLAPLSTPPSHQVSAASSAPLLHQRLPSASQALRMLGRLAWLLQCRRLVSCPCTQPRIVHSADHVIFSFSISGLERIGRHTYNGMCRGAGVATSPYGSLPEAMPLSQNMPEHRVGISQRPQGLLAGAAQLRPFALMRPRSMMPHSGVRMRSTRSRTTGRCSTASSTPPLHAPHPQPNKLATCQGCD